MKVYTDGTCWFVANDLEDVKAVFSEHIGDWDAEMQSLDNWRPCPDATPIVIVLTEAEEQAKFGAGGEVTKHGIRATKTAAEWVALHGRGLLCSTEF